MSIVAYLPQMKAAKQTSESDARAYWATGAWHRLAPLVQGWAALGVPLTLGLSGDDVDDIVAHVLVRAWTQREVPLAPAAWCRTVAHHRALDTLKRRETVSLDKHEPTAAVRDVEGELHYRTEVGRLRVALRRLADPIRRVVVLHWLHGQPHHQIAATLGITEGASKMRASRGLRMLRQVYGDTPSPGLTARGLPRKPAGRPPRPQPWHALCRLAAPPNEPSSPHPVPTHV